MSLYSLSRLLVAAPVQTSAAAGWVAESWFFRPTNTDIDILVLQLHFAPFAYQRSTKVVLMVFGGVAR